VEATTYNHIGPIVNIFTEINAYGNMVDNATHAAKTTAQLINIGIIIITWLTTLSSNIHKWHDKREANKT
jgi:hypothetical protein